MKANVTSARWDFGCCSQSRSPVFREQLSGISALIHKSCPADRIGPGFQFFLATTLSVLSAA
jgi:hypothetical protein